MAVWAEHLDRDSVRDSRWQAYDFGVAVVGFVPLGRSLTWVGLLWRT